MEAAYRGTAASTCASLALPAKPRSTPRRHGGPVQRIFETTSFTASDWLFCFVVASTVLWVEELLHLVARRRA